jgi:hypothetical protein
MNLPKYKGDEKTPITDKLFVVIAPLLFLLILFTGATGQPPYSSGAEVKVIHGGKEVQFYNGLPFLYDNRLLVPLQTIALEFNVNIEYDSETCEVTIFKPRLPGIEQKIKFQIDNSIVDIDGSEKVQLEVAPLIRDGIVYMPLRFIVETFDRKMFWDDENKIAYITD